MSKKRLHYAQVQALRWLQSRVEDQFVRSYIGMEISLLQRLKHPIADNGTELIFPKQDRKPKVLPGQTHLEDGLR